MQIKRLNELNFDLEAMELFNNIQNQIEKLIEFELVE
jgi:hypothetical protein